MRIPGNVTHTYAVLELSQRAFEEIKGKLDEAGYQHAYHQEDDGSIVIDMHGIGVKAEAPTAATIGGQCAADIGGNQPASADKRFGNFYIPPDARVKTFNTIE